MSNLNTNINDYSIGELFVLAELDEDSTKDEIEEHFTKIIQSYLKTKNYGMAQFFHEAKEKVLETLNSDNNKADSKNWLENLYGNPINKMIDKDTMFNRRHETALFTNSSERPIMERKDMAITNNIPLELSQDTLNPTLRQKVFNNIYIDSDDRNNTIPFIENPNTPNSTTNFTINLSEPLKNVLSMRLETLNIPKTIFTFDPWYSNNTLIVVTASHSSKFNDSFETLRADSDYSATRISMAPGTYPTSVEFVNQLNLDLSFCLLNKLKGINNELLLQVHLVNPTTLGPKVVFINGSTLAVKIIFYAVPGIGPYSFVNKGNTKDISSNSVLDKLDYPCYSEPYYNNNLGYYMGYRVKMNLTDSKIINSDSNYNELAIILESSEKHTEIALALTHLYNNLGNWDIAYNAIRYSRDMYNIINIDTSNTQYYNIATGSLKLTPTKYLYICVNDYQNHRAPSAIIRAGQPITQLSIPSYVNMYNYSKKSSLQEQLNDISSQVVCDVSPNNDNSGNSIIVPTWPRKITQNQIYSANSILNDSRKQTISSVTNVSDVIGIIPLNYALDGNTIDTNILFKPREYFGPINLERLGIQLKDDKGNLINLNGNSWGFNLIIEQLYQY